MIIALLVGIFIEFSDYNYLGQKFPKWSQNNSNLVNKDINKNKFNVHIPVNLGVGPCQFSKTRWWIYKNFILGVAMKSEKIVGGLHDKGQ